MSWSACWMSIQSVGHVILLLLILSISVYCVSRKIWSASRIQKRATERGMERGTGRGTEWSMERGTEGSISAEATVRETEAKITSIELRSKRFISEVKKKTKKLGDSNEIRGVNEKISMMEKLFLRNLEMQEVHVDASLGVWPETVRLGITFLKELRDLKADFEKLQTVVKNNADAVTVLQLEMQAASKASKLEMQAASKASKLEMQAASKASTDAIKALQLEMQAASKASTDAIKALQQMQAASKASKLEIQAASKASKLEMQAASKASTDAIKALQLEMQAASKARTDALQTQMSSLQTQKEDRDALLLYSDWINRCVDIAATILGINSFELQNALWEENIRFANPWVDGKFHCQLYDKVLKNLKLNTSTWDVSKTFKFSWSIHNSSIKTSTGAVLQQMLTADFKRLKISSPFPQQETDMLKKILSAINAYYFPEVPLE